MKYLLTTLLLAATVASNAQSKGLITYEKKINLHKQIQNEEMKNFVPEFRTTKHQLLFNDSSSLYKELEEVQQPDAFENNDGGARRVMRFGAGGTNTVVYKNTNTSLILEARELFDENYLVTDTIKQMPWKLTEETKTILNHTCKKAITKMPANARGGGMRMQFGGSTPQDGEGKKAVTPPTPPAPRPDITVEAWYATDIPVSNGPENFGGLPGLILQLNSDNETMLITATELKDTYVEKEFKIPNKGKKVTKQGFADAAKKMFEQMQQNGGGGRSGIRIMN